MTAVDYVVWPETRMVRSNETRGSMTVHHVPQLIALHAVVRDDVGKVTKTGCGKPCLIRPEDGEPKSWDQVNFYLKCAACMAEVGDAPVGPDGKQYFPPPRF